MSNFEIILINNFKIKRVVLNLPNLHNEDDDYGLLIQKTIFIMEAKIQFIKGLDEKVLPDVRLTRSRDGSTGTATFRFKNPNILDKNTAKNGEITGMYLIDEEGILETRDVNAYFRSGKPEMIESIYIMKSPKPGIDL